MLSKKIKPNIRKFTTIKQKAWKFYDKWLKEKTYCPAFKQEVRISLKGWKHISGSTGSKKRSFLDTQRRLKLLPYAKKIISESSLVQNITTKNKRKYYALEAMVSPSKKVRVVLIEDKLGNKIFYSVMDKKIR